MIIVKDKVHIFTTIKINFLLGNGYLINLKMVFIQKSMMKMLKRDQLTHISKINTSCHKLTNLSSLIQLTFLKELWSAQNRTELISVSNTYQLKRCLPNKNTKILEWHLKQFHLVRPMLI